MEIPVDLSHGRIKKGECGMVEWITVWREAWRGMSRAVGAISNFKLEISKEITFPHPSLP